MSLLYNEPPIAVSPTLAKELGLNAAVFLQQLHYWTEEKSRNRDRYKDSFQGGYFWVYNSIEEWLKQLPFLGSKATFKRLLAELQEKGILVIECHNKAGFDKTNWYRINYLRLEQITKSVSHAWAQNEPTIGSKCTNGEAQNEPTYTRDYTETTTKILNTPFNPPTGETSERDQNSVSDFSQTTGRVIADQGNAIAEQSNQPPQTTEPKTPAPSSAAPPSPAGFDEFWQQYPAKVAKPAALKAWRKLKPGQALQDAIAKDIAIRKENDRKWVDGFVPNPATYLNQERWNDDIQPLKQQSKPMSKHDQNMAVLANYANKKGVKVHGLN